MKPSPADTLKFVDEFVAQNSSGRDALLWNPVTKRWVFGEHPVFGGGNNQAMHRMAVVVADKYQNSTANRDRLCRSLLVKARDRMRMPDKATAEQFYTASPAKQKLLKNRKAWRDIKRSIGPDELAEIQETALRRLRVDRYGEARTREAEASGEILPAHPEYDGKALAAFA